MYVSVWSTDTEYGVQTTYRVEYEYIQLASTASTELYIMNTSIVHPLSNDLGLYISKLSTRRRNTC